MPDSGGANREPRYNESMKPNRTRYFSLALPASLALFFVSTLFGYSLGKSTIARKDSCVRRELRYEVSGGSLEPILSQGQHVNVRERYYDCNPVRRGDLVTLFYAGKLAPLVKIAKGIPGDAFALIKEKDGGNWNMEINGRTLKNSLGEPYLVDIRGKNILSLYERDYGGKIPENTYLLLGNLASAEGSLDSRNFGLVNKSDFIGIAVR